MSSPLLFHIESSLPSSPQTSQAPQDVSPSSLPPETTKFFYSSLHRVDSLVRHYHTLRAESNSQANLLAHLSTRLSLLAHSSLGPSVRTIDYDNSLRPLQRLSLADRMSISLKDNLDRCMIELDNSLSEMELVYMSVDDILITLCELVNSFGVEVAELLKGVKHVQQIYLELTTEVRGIDLLSSIVLTDQHVGSYGISSLRMRRESHLCWQVHWVTF